MNLGIKISKNIMGDINTFLSEKDLNNFKQLEMSQNSQIDGLDLKTNSKGSYHDQKDRKRKTINLRQESEISKRNK